MLEFIQNPWVIGIVGGIVCGIIVWLLTRCAISSKGNNEYIKKIYQANDEVFLSLKPYIADKGLPDQEIIEAMIASTARKYLLKASDMYTVQIFCEELIKDITSNVYFSWEEKKRYSNDLRTFIEDLNRQTDKKTAAEIDAKVSDIEHKKRLSEIKRKDLNTVSMIAGLFTAVVTLVLALMANSFFPLCRRVQQLCALHGAGRYPVRHRQLRRAAFVYQGQHCGPPQAGRQGKAQRHCRGCGRRKRQLDRIKLCTMAAMPHRCEGKWRCGIFFVSGNPMHIHVIKRTRIWVT